MGICVLAIGLFTDNLTYSRSKDLFGRDIVCKYFADNVLLHIRINQIHPTGINKKNEGIRKLTIFIELPPGRTHLISM